MFTLRQHGMDLQSKMSVKATRLTGYGLENLIVYFIHMLYYSYNYQALDKQVVS